MEDISTDADAMRYPISGCFLISTHSVSDRSSRFQQDLIVNDYLANIMQCGQQRQIIQFKLRQPKSVSDLPARGLPCVPPCSFVSLPRSNIVVLIEDMIALQMLPRSSNL